MRPTNMQVLTIQDSNLMSNVLWERLLDFDSARAFDIQTRCYKMLNVLMIKKICITTVELGTNKSANYIAKPDSKVTCESILKICILTLKSKCLTRTRYKFVYSY